MANASDESSPFRNLVRLRGTRKAPIIMVREEDFEEFQAHKDFKSALAAFLAKEARIRTENRKKRAELKLQARQRRAQERAQHREARRQRQAAAGEQPEEREDESSSSSESFLSDPDKHFDEHIAVVRAEDELVVIPPVAPSDENAMAERLKEAAQGVSSTGESSGALADQDVPVISTTSGSSEGENGEHYCEDSQEWSGGSAGEKKSDNLKKWETFLEQCEKAGMDKVPEMASRMLREQHDHHETRHRALFRIESIFQGYTRNASDSDRHRSIAIAKATLNAVPEAPQQKGGTSSGFTTTGGLVEDSWNIMDEELRLLSPTRVDFEILSMSGEVIARGAAPCCNLRLTRNKRDFCELRPEHIFRSLVQKLYAVSVLRYSLSFQAPHALAKYAVDVGKRLEAALKLPKGTFDETALVHDGEVGSGPTDHVPFWTPERLKAQEEYIERDDCRMLLVFKKQHWIYKSQTDESGGDCGEWKRVSFGVQVSVWQGRVIARGLITRRKSDGAIILPTTWRNHTEFYCFENMTLFDDDDYYEAPEAGGDESAFCSEFHVLPSRTYERNKCGRTAETTWCDSAAECAEQEGANRVGIYVEKEAQLRAKAGSSAGSATNAEAAKNWASQSKVYPSVVIHENVGLDEGDYGDYRVTVPHKKTFFQCDSDENAQAVFDDLKRFVDFIQGASKEKIAAKHFSLRSVVKAIPWFDQKPAISSGPVGNWERDVMGLDQIRSHYPMRDRMRRDEPAAALSDGVFAISKASGGELNPDLEKPSFGKATWADLVRAVSQHRGVDGETKFGEPIMIHWGPKAVVSDEPADAEEDASDEEDDRSDGGESLLSYGNETPPSARGRARRANDNVRAAGEHMGDADWLVGLLGPG
ncbi:unnamed protein product [Amoebophrya sp. A120]|nr:unnamed protein product [Amoebophrya sp. A120]|eukprot:GSA120T00001101001.1